MIPELSMIQALNVEGSVLENGTIRDINLQRGGFNTWIPNRPRYRHQTWKVQPLIPELSAIRGTNVEGPALNPEPSAISTLSVEGSTPNTRTIRDTGPKHGGSNP